MGTGMSRATGRSDRGQSRFPVFDPRNRKPALTPRSPFASSSWGASVPVKSWIAECEVELNRAIKEGLVTWED